MVRLIVRMVGAGFVIGLCPWAIAGEAEDFMKYYSWWNGEWEVETKIGDQMDSDHFVIQQHEPACHLVKSKGSISLWGYDPGEKKWVGTGFDAEGRRFITVTERHKRDAIKPGNVNKSKTVSWLPDGTKVVSEGTWTYVDENTAELRDSRITASGEKLAEIVTIGRRK